MLFSFYKSQMAKYWIVAFYANSKYFFLLFSISYFNIFDASKLSTILLALAFVSFNDLIKVIFSSILPYELANSSKRIISN